MRICLTACVATIALLIPQLSPASEALSQDEALKWLQKMGQSLHHLNYDGVFVYQHGDRLSAMRLIHGHDELGEQERLVSLTGTSREVIRNNDQVTCILPDTRSVIVERKGQSKPGFPYLLPKQIKQISDVYHFELGHVGRIAGRSAQQVRILPLDKYRYSYHLWLDKDTGMLLKAEVINGRNIVEQFMFTNLKFMKSISDKLFNPDVDHKAVLSYHHEQGQENQSVKLSKRQWKVKNLPAGFNLTHQQYRFQADNNDPVQHLVYSDGLSTVSLFIEKLRPGQAIMQGASPMGAVHTFSRMIGHTQVTAVGEVPANTVKQIAESVQFIGK